MRGYLLLICWLLSSVVFAQTPVLRPRPVTIDLANPKAGMQGLSKEERKRWKEVQKQKKKELKLKDKLYEHMLDSAQLANYEKYNNQSMDLPEKPDGFKAMLQSLTQEELAAYQSGFKQKYGIPDSVDLTRVNDSTYFQSLDPQVKERLEAYSDWSTDSLTYSIDSLGTPTYSPVRPMVAGKLTEENLDNQAQQTLAQSGNTSGLAGLPREEQMMFSSYEEMIASDRYQELMKDVPGMKADIEHGFGNQSLDKEDLPVPESVFAGHEEQLASAMSATTIVRKKPTFKDLLKQFFDQDMADVQEKSTIQRFSLTGYVQFSHYDPLIIDYSPSIAYAFTGKARIGTGVSGRLKVGSGETDEETNLFAYRGFLEYDILKNIYLHGEYERTGLKVTDPTTDIETREWSDRWLLGLGTDLQLPGILNGSLLILYNFDNDLANSPNPRRFQIRYGLKIN